MNYVERMRTLALVAQEPEVRELMMHAADRIEQLTQWKLLWAKTHEELEQVRREFAEYRKENEVGRKES